MALNEAQWASLGRLAGHTMVIDGEAVRVMGINKFTGTWTLLKGSAYVRFAPTEEWLRDLLRSINGSEIPRVPAQPDLDAE